MSNNTEETVIIFTGTSIGAQALTSRLEDLNIIPIIRDDYENGSMFGSAPDISEYVRVFIRKDELAAAQPIIDAFLKDMQE